MSIPSPCRSSLVIVATPRNLTVFLGKHRKNPAKKEKSRRTGGVVVSLTVPRSNHARTRTGFMMSLRVPSNRRTRYGYCRPLRLPVNTNTYCSACDGCVVFFTEKCFSIIRSAPAAVSHLLNSRRRTSSARTRIVAITPQKQKKYYFPVITTSTAIPPQIYGNLLFPRKNTKCRYSSAKRQNVAIPPQEQNNVSPREQETSPADRWTRPVVVPSAGRPERGSLA